MAGDKRLLTVLLVLMALTMVLPQASVANIGGRANPPIVKCDLKSPSYYPLGSTIWITGTATDDTWVAYLQIMTNTVTSWQNITSSYDNFTKKFSWPWDTSKETAGAHSVSIQARDSYGQSGMPVNVAITLDGDDPAVSIKQPSGTTNIMGLGDTIQISGEASDATSSVTSLNMSFDGGLTWTDITSYFKGKTWSYSWVTKATDPPKTHKVIAQATDVVGHQNNATVDIMLVDLRPPQVAFTQPSDNTEVTGWESIILKGTATDNIGIVDLEIAATPKGGTPKKTNITGRINAGTWGWTWDSKTLAAGKYVVQVWAKDRKGNQATSTLNLTFTDKAPPLVSLTSPLPLASYSHGETIFVMGKVSDNIKLQKVELLLDATTPVNITSEVGTGGAYQHALTGVKDGTHVIKIRATDMSANTNDTQVTIKVKPVPAGVPVAAIAGGVVVVVVVVIILLFIAMKKGWIGSKKQPAQSSTTVAAVPPPTAPAQPYPPTQAYQPAQGPYGSPPQQQYQPAQPYVQAQPLAPYQPQPVAYRPSEPVTTGPPQLELEPPVPAPVPIDVDAEEEVEPSPPPFMPKMEEPRPAPKDERPVEVITPPIPGPTPKKPEFQRPTLAKNPHQAPAQCPACGLDVDYETLMCKECGAKLF
jgi:hypothetical protein